MGIITLKSPKCKQNLSEPVPGLVRAPRIDDLQPVRPIRPLKKQKIFNTLALESSLRSIPQYHRAAGRTLYLHLLENTSWQPWTATARCGRKINVERGEIFTSYRKLGGQLGWNKDQVAGVLAALERVRLVDRHPCPEGTLLALPLYDLHMANNEEFGRKVLNIVEIQDRVKQLPKINQEAGAVLFRHLVHVAHFRHGNVRRFTLQPGDTLSSLRKMCVETGLSFRQVRTALEALEKYGLVKTFSTWAGTRIRIIGYNCLHIQANSQGGGTPPPESVSHYKNRISEDDFQKILHGFRHPPIRTFYNFTFNRKKDYKKPSPSLSRFIYMPESEIGSFQEVSREKEIKVKKSEYFAAIEIREAKRESYDASYCPTTKKAEYQETMQVLKAHEKASPLVCFAALQKFDLRYILDPVKYLAYLLQGRGSKSKNRLGLSWYLLSEAKYPPPAWAVDRAREVLYNSPTETAEEREHERLQLEAESEKARKKQEEARLRHEKEYQAEREREAQERKAEKYKASARRTEEGIKAFRKRLARHSREDAEEYARKNLYEEAAKAAIKRLRAKQRTVWKDVTTLGPEEEARRQILYNQLRDLRAREISESEYGGR